MSDKWDRHFLDICNLVATMSKDRSTKTGCVVVRQDNSVASTGFNGFPRGINDDLDERHERPAKYLWTEHCDRNAILTASKHGVSLKDCVMYLTGPPCADCTRAIIQSGICEVVWPTPNQFEDAEAWDRWKDNMTVAWTMMDEAGVNYRRVDMGQPS
jgi:dCMP deaminase